MAIRPAGGSSTAIIGAAAGAFSTLVFTFVHDLMISDIWAMLVPMLIAGVLCGLCVRWSFNILESRHGARAWLRYNLVYTAMFCVLTVVSLLVFEPVATLGELLELNGPPDELIGQAMPLTIVFTFGMAALITRAYRGGWRAFSAALLTSIVLVLLLGLNISTVGLVFFPSGTWYLVGEMLGLILLLNLVYAGTVLFIERAIFRIARWEKAAS